MKQFDLVNLGLILALVAVPASADYYETKADRQAGKAGSAPASLRAGADGCASPPVIAAPLPFGDSGDTTGAGDSVSFICQSGDCESGGTLCDGILEQVLGPDHIYQFTVAAGNDLTFTVTTADDDYDPAIYLLSACGQGNTCIIGADDCFSANDGGCGGGSSAEFFNTTLSPGTYFVFVDSFYSALGGVNPAAADGAYDLSVTGTLPVQLIEFEVD